jgi:hypothetical protein
MKLSLKPLLVVNRCLIIGMAVMGLLGCASGAQGSENRQDKEEQAAVSVPEFCADSAYQYVKRQVEFGPRVPATDAHARCGAWLQGELLRHGADTVVLQQAQMEPVGNITNIMGRFNLRAPRRILLLAHWDTRPWADNDPDEANHTRPIDGANDGGSGVGVLLEVARLIGAQAPAVGVDILFVDGEDSGSEGDDASWALGAQHYASNLLDPKPQCAILLDMVGGRDAQFTREYFSQRYAPELVDAIWSAASKAGEGSRFRNRMGGAINDDHLPLIQAGVPAVDIIECSNQQTGSFPPTWHTLSDNLENIDTATLGVVGRVITYYIYNK